MRSTSSGSASATCWPPRKRSARPFSNAAGSKCRRSLRKMSASSKCSRVDLDAAAVDAGDVEQLGEQALERVDRLVDAVDELRHLGLVGALAQRLGEQAHRVQRLAQVVAGGGEELGLGAVGDLGLAARRVGGELLGAQLRGERVGAQLQGDRRCRTTAR